MIFRGVTLEELDTGFSDTFADQSPSLISVFTIIDRHRIGWQTLELGKVEPVPVTGAYINRNDNGRTLLMSLQGPTKLYLVAVVGTNEVSANQQQYDVRILKAVRNGRFPFITGNNTPVVPKYD